MVLGEIKPQGVLRTVYSAAQDSWANERAVSTYSPSSDETYKTSWLKLREYLPFLTRGQATHCFRHSALTEMKESGVDLELRADVAGQGVPGETGGRYSKEAALDRKLAAIEALPKVTIELDATPVRLRPMGMRKPKKARRPKITALSA